LKNKHVYCTNCKHFKIVDKYQKDDEGMVYCKYDAKGLCDVRNFEDSRPLPERPCYESMDAIICLVGPSGTGKTSIAYALHEKYGYNVIESYTTRPKRYEGEKGHTFVDEFEDEVWNFFPWMDGKMLSSNVIAYNQYDDFEYWATREQYQDKGVSIYVVDVPGVEMLRKTVKDAEIVVVALHADKTFIQTRLLERDIFSRKKKDKAGDTFDMLRQRMLLDEDVFAVIPCNYSVDANPDLDTVTERVNSIIQMHVRG
jgi:guanylate kinase